MRHRLPKHPHIAIIYAIMAIIMLPWAFTLADELPKRHLVDNWHLVWLGYDIIMGIVFLATAYGLYKRRYWVPISASVSATLVLCDAWFDIGTARTHSQIVSAVLLAVIVEIPISLLSFWIAYKTLGQEVPKSFKK